SEGEQSASGVEEAHKIMAALGIAPTQLIEGAYVDLLAQTHAEHRRACSGREGLNLTGASPVVPIARFRHVAIPQFVLGNHTFFAWRKRPGCPEDLELLR